MLNARPKAAPRPPTGFCRPRARGAGLALFFWLAGGAVGIAQIQDAQYREPTPRYPHGVLGDSIEYGALEVTTAQGAVHLFRLPQERVFEDLEPRVVDVTGDGAPEVVVIESHQSQGARLAIYDETGLIEATPYIGMRFRWLAPAATTDLDGDGLIELAYVDRPHLAKTLRIWSFDPTREKGERLVARASLPGVSNHRIGWPYIIGGLRNCPNGPETTSPETTGPEKKGPEILLASGDWRRLLAIRFDGRLHSQDLGRYSPEALEKATNCD